VTVLEIATHRRCEMIDVTSRVQEIVSQARLRDGFVIGYVPHTTAALTIQENADPDVTRDLLYKLEQLVPHRDADYQHAEGNSDAHIKASLVGASQTILVRDGRLALGVWQAIYFAEFDGPRRRQMYVLCNECGREHDHE
jgi:secondary thiamine-phosphate synthase enzyme